VAVAVATQHRQPDSRESTRELPPPSVPRFRHDVHLVAALLRSSRFSSTSTSWQTVSSSESTTDAESQGHPRRGLTAAETHKKPSSFLPSDLNVHSGYHLQFLLRGVLSSLGNEKRQRRYSHHPMDAASHNGALSLMVSVNAILRNNNAERERSAFKVRSRDGARLFFEPSYYDVTGSGGGEK